MMMTWHRNVFCINGPLWGKSTSRHWVSHRVRAGNAKIDVSFIVASFNKLLNKQPSSQWFDMPWYLFWYHCNVMQCNTVHKEDFVGKNLGGTVWIVKHMFQWTLMISSKTNTKLAVSSYQPLWSYSFRTQVMKYTNPISPNLFDAIETIY